MGEEIDAREEVMLDNAEINDGLVKYIAEELYELVVPPCVGSKDEDDLSVLADEGVAVDFVDVPTRGELIEPLGALRIEVNDEEDDLSI